MADVTYLDTATVGFLALQSGLARPYWEANITIDKNSNEELTNGNMEVWSAGTAVAPDGWTLYGAGATVARGDIAPKVGTYFAILVRNNADCDLYQNVHVSKGIDYWKGRTVTFGCWVFTSAANRAFIYISEEGGITGSSYHTGSGTWEWLTCTHTVSNSATVVQITFDIRNGDTTAYFDGAVCRESSYLYWSGTLGQAYEPTNNILSMGAIDKEKSITIAGTDELIAGDITIKLSNREGLYSPLNPSGIFYEKDWLNSTIKVWAGFCQTSGTALVIPRGTFIMDELRIDSHDGLAYLHCQDRLKFALDKYVGLPYPSGTSHARIFTGTVSSKTILSTLLNEINVNDYDLSAGVDFANLTISGQTYGWCLAKIAAASEGFIYVDNVGKIRFKQHAGNFDAVRNTWALNQNDSIAKFRYTIGTENLVNEVGVRWAADLLSYASLEATASVPKGKAVVLENPTVYTNARANSIASRNLEEYKTASAFLEVDNLWLPAADLGDYFNIYDNNTYLSGPSSRIFELYKIRDDFQNLTTKLYMREVAAGLKFGFFSDTAVSVTSVDYSGGWGQGFCFFGRDSGTAVTPGFDDSSGEGVAHSGANNNVINQSGTPRVSIEEPFVFT